MYAATGIGSVSMRGATAVSHAFYTSGQAFFFFNGGVRPTRHGPLSSSSLFFLPFRTLLWAISRLRGHAAPMRCPALIRRCSGGFVCNFSTANDSWLRGGGLRPAVGWPRVLVVAARLETEGRYVRV